MRKFFHCFFCLIILVSAYHPPLEAKQPIIPSVLNRTDQRHGYVAACMIFQNEAPYLKEWLEYHKNLGISHFFLYNNASKDNFWSILLPYILSGEVELFNLYEIKTDAEEFFTEQRLAYEHAVLLALGQHEWLAIIDNDEYICIPSGEKLPTFLTRYLDAPGLAINWVMFGSSYVQQLEPNELQIERFFLRAPDNWPEHFMVKSIVRPQYVAKADIHICEYAPGLAAVFADHQRFSHHALFSVPPIDMIRINHYWWRDEKYFYDVKLPRRASWQSGYSAAEIAVKRKSYNSIEDYSIWPTIPAMKLAMATDAHSQKTFAASLPTSNKAPVCDALQRRLQLKFLSINDKWSKGEWTLSFFDSSGYFLKQQGAFTSIALNDSKIEMTLYKPSYSGVFKKGSPADTDVDESPVVAKIIMNNPDLSSLKCFVRHVDPQGIMLAKDEQFTLNLKTTRENAL